MSRGILTPPRETPAPTLSRRSLLRAGGGAGALITVSLVGCTSDTEPDGSEISDYSTPGPDRPHESPMLTEQVEAGDLPRLEDRLPVEADRLVVESPEFGVYGGIYQGAYLGSGDEVWLQRLVSFEPMLRPSLDLTEEGLPGTLKGVDVSTDGAEYTLHLREGLRWSDGEPVTADDVMFALEEVYFNEDVHASTPEMLSVDGQPCSPERIDDYTVKLTFPGPKGNFIDLASRQTGGGGNLFYYPQHYLKEFLPHLNAGAEQAADEAGFSDWVDYWEDRTEWWNNPDKPVLHAWIVERPVNEGTLTSLTRNPYYWKTDSDGAQLPFIDQLELEVVGEDEVMLLKALNGEIDFHERHFNTDQNRPVLAEGREDGQYEFVDVDTTHMNRLIIALNLNHNDEQIREIFGNKDFRIGLSHAIDRQDIIDTVYQRQGEPWQAAPHRESEFFDEEFAKQYTAYDVDLANQYLDDAGLTETDSDGFRLAPNGHRLTFQIDVTPAEPHWVPAVDMVTQQWAEVGIDASVNTIERTLFYDRKEPSANEHDANVWHGEGGYRVEMIETRWWFPTNAESTFAPRWADWYSTRGHGDHADEPPEATTRQMELQWQIFSEPDPAVQAQLFQEILDIAKEQFYVIGIALSTQGYGIVANDLRNVAETYTDTPQYLAPGYTNPSAWFFDR